MLYFMHSIIYNKNFIELCFYFIDLIKCLLYNRNIIKQKQRNEQVNDHVATETLWLVKIMRK